MGKAIREQAAQLGVLKLRETVLYARARKIRVKQEFFTVYIPDVMDAIHDYMIWHDPSLIQDRSGIKNVTYYYLAPQVKLYVEISDKPSFWTVNNPANHALQIRIFSETEEYIRGIASAVNALWDDKDGILVHMDWDWIEKQYLVKREDCIAVWKSLL